jgi:putative hydrolase of the HAD superfamily
MQRRAGERPAMIAATMPPRAILLDALGTLVALEPPAPVLGALLRERHGIEVSPEDAQRAMGAEMRHYSEQCVRAADNASLTALREECAAIIAGELALALPPSELVATLLASVRFHAFPEVPATLARWRAAGVRLVVASNWDVSLHGVLRATGLRERLDGVVTSAEVGAAKPAPELFAAALEVAGAAADSAIHIGDSLVEDVEGARAAGIDPVWLARDGAVAGAPAGTRVIGALDELVLAP